MLTGVTYEIYANDEGKKLQLWQVTIERGKDYCQLCHFRQGKYSFLVNEAATENCPWNNEKCYFICDQTNYDDPNNKANQCVWREAVTV
jgi:hypothetical protein